MHGATTPTYMVRHWLGGDGPNVGPAPLRITTFKSALKHMHAAVLFPLTSIWSMARLRMPVRHQRLKHAAACHSTCPSPPPPSPS